MKRYFMAAIMTVVCLLSIGATADVATAQSQDEPAYVLRTHPVTIRTFDGLQLFGTLSLPVDHGDGKIPAALLIQGSGPTDRDGNQPPGLTTDLLKKMAFTLAKSGIATLRFDKRGLNGNLPREAGKLAAFSRWENFVSDAAAAFRTLAERTEIDSSRIAVIGHSEGGMLALELASQLANEGRQPAALVLAATPGRTMDVVMRSQLEALGQRQGGGPAAATALAAAERAMNSIKATGTVPADLPPNVAPLFPAYLAPFYRSFFAVDTPKLAGRYPGPVLLLFGMRDQQVSPVEDAKPLQAALATRQNDDSELLRVRGASHNFKLVAGPNDPGFEGRLAPSVSNKLRSWLSNKLRSSTKSRFPDDDELVDK